MVSIASTYKISMSSLAQCVLMAISRSHSESKQYGRKEFLEFAAKCYDMAENLKGEKDEGR